MKEYSVKELEKATSEHLERLKKSKVLYTLALRLAKKLLAYSKNFKISYSSLIDGDNDVLSARMTFTYLGAYQFSVQMYIEPSALYPKIFTVSALDENAYSIDDFYVCSDDVDEVFNAIVNLAEGKTGLAS